MMFLGAALKRPELSRQGMKGRVHADCPMLVFQLRVSIRCLPLGSVIRKRQHTFDSSTPKYRCEVSVRLRS